jgi:hypothetical protein
MQDSSKPAATRSASPTESERVALLILRRAAGQERQCLSASPFVPGLIEREFSAVEAHFRALFAPHCAACGVRPVQLGMACCLNITKDERRLLNAAAVLQAGDDSLLDNYLYRLALDRAARKPLAEAVAQLAAALAVHGYWLPRPNAAPIPAAALTAARAQGRDVRHVRVTWP